MPKLLDISKFCENLPEVTTFEIIDKKKFHPNGLFSEQLFGPIRNYTCQCKIYRGVSKSGGKCNICNVDIVNSNVRRRRFGKIVLPFPIVNPMFFELLSFVGGKKVKEMISMLMKNDKSILYKDDNGEFVITTDIESIPKEKIFFEKTEAIKEFITQITKEILKDEENPELSYWNIIKENLNNILINEVIVLPPDLRPPSKTTVKNVPVADPINRFYVQLLTNKKIIENTLVEVQKNKKIYYMYFKEIQKTVNQLYVFILEKLSKKEGLIRGNILGKRIDFSGRAVIVPSPTINIDECVLPYVMILELFKIQIAQKLVNNESFKILNEAIDFVDRCIDLKSLDLYKEAEEIVKGEVCILNRQPTLHRLGMLGFKIKISSDNVIKIHPLACEPFNADFDGDQMAVYLPISQEAKDEVLDKLLITNNLNSPSNGQLATMPNQDIILGIYMLTNDKFPDLTKETIFKNIKITEGRKLFNECFPEDYPIINYSVGKNELLKILSDISQNYSKEILAIVLDKIKLLGFKYSTIFGTTMSLIDCTSKDSKEYVDKIFSGENIRKQIEDISSNETIETLKKIFKYSYMVESGARGTWDQVRQIVLSRGFISNFEGQILPEPIKNSLMNGLTKREFFISTYGCRKGLLDVALNTGISGYLSRKLIFTCCNLQLDLNLEDCGTKDCIELFIENADKSKSLIGRNYIENNELKKITMLNFKSLVGKTLKLRSPIYCESENICKTCYGDLYKIINSKFIGVVAAQCLGERGTQLVLRTFHTSGSAIINEKSEEKIDEMKQMDIIGDLETASDLLHRFKDNNFMNSLNNLFKVYSSSGKIHHVHFECVISQLMWHGMKKWRLTKDRDKKSLEMKSVQSVPSYESWLLALAFSNPKKSILNGMVYKGLYTGIMDRILKGEKV